jgi:hypothetical protein
VEIIQPKRLGHLLAVLVLGGCVPTVMTPTVTVMPTPGKSLEVFAAEQGACKQFAEQQITAARNQLNNQVMANALLTNADDPVAAGQAVAASGVPVLQQQYDAAYSQCMYAKGNQVPGYAAAPVGPAPARRARPRPRQQAPAAQPASADKFVEPASSAPAAAEPFKEPPAAR